MRPVAEWFEEVVEGEGFDLLFYGWKLEGKVVELHASRVYDTNWVDVDDEEAKVLYERARPTPSARP